MKSLRFFLNLPINRLHELLNLLAFGQSLVVHLDDHDRDLSAHSHFYGYLDVCLVEGYANAIHPYSSLYLPIWLGTLQQLKRTHPRNTPQDPYEPRNTLLCSERILSASQLPKRLNFQPIHHCTSNRSVFTIIQPALQATFCRQSSSCSMDVVLPGARLGEDLNPDATAAKKRKEHGPIGKLQETRKA